MDMKWSIVMTLLILVSISYDVTWIVYGMAILFVWLSWALKMKYDTMKEIYISRIKDIATDFYYWWHNQPGTNTQDGFDEWWKKNKDPFL